MTYKIIGDAKAEWEDENPFIFTISETSGSIGEQLNSTISIDYSELRQGFSDEFILHLKDHLIQRRTKVVINSINGESRNLRRLFRKVIDLKLFKEKTSVIDESFLLALDATIESFTYNDLRFLKMAFISNPCSPIFAQSLHKSDFPEKADKKGKHGRIISGILAKAHTRAACVNILCRCEQAYEKGHMDIGFFSFVNLAFAVFCRPESYRQIRLEDLNFDNKSKSFYIYISPAKSSVHRPRKICFQINANLAALLQKQRQHVVQKYGHLVQDKEMIGKLALFPARRLKQDMSAWVANFPNQNFGMLKSGSDFSKSYTEVVQRWLLDARHTIGANALRHTAGTQLAMFGASAQTIKAVLKHAGDDTCKAYVDIAFHGLINELSDAIQPAFKHFLPAIERFRSKNDLVPPDKAIRTDNLRTGETLLAGECGKKIQCEHAPIACYGCHRFIPCWDADHSMNLRNVQEEIDSFKQMGKPFQHMVDKALEAKYQILFVMNASEIYRKTLSIDAQL